MNLVFGFWSNDMPEIGLYQSVHKYGNISPRHYMPSNINKPSSPQLLKKKITKFMNINIRVDIVSFVTLSFITPTQDGSKLKSTFIVPK